MASLAAYFSGDNIPKPSAKQRERDEQKKKVISGFSIDIKNDRPSGYSSQSKYRTVVRGLYNIDKRTCCEAVLAAARSALTVTPKGQTIAIPRSYPLYQETTNFLQVPRYYGLNFMGYPTDDQTTDGEPLVNVQINVSPRDYQVDILNALQKIFARGGGLGAGALLVCVWRRQDLQCNSYGDSARAKDRDSGP